MNKIKLGKWMGLGCAGVLLILIIACSTPQVAEVMNYEPEPAVEMTVSLGPHNDRVPGLSAVLVFSEPVDFESLKENIILIPDVPYYIFQDDDYIVNIQPKRAWSETQSHTHIIIETGYVNEDGYSFNSPQILSFLADNTPSPSPALISTPTPVPTIKPSPTPAVTPEEDRPTVRYFGSGASYILNSKDNMTIGFTARNLEERIPVIVETYRLPSIARLEQQGDIFRDNDVPLTLLERTDTNVFLLDNGDFDFAVAHQGEGAYIVAVTYTDPFSKEESHHRASYMITPLSVYLQATNRDTLVWINSSQSDSGVQGLSIHFGDDTEPTAATDRNGMAFFNRSKKVEETDPNEGDDESSGEKENNERYFRIYNPKGELVYYDNGVQQSIHGLRERYYSYLFLDRTIYRPQDTINFWGVVQPFRNNERDMPDTVRITFDANGINLEQDVPLGPGGVFNGTIELERIRSAQYSIQASLHFPPEDEEEPEGGSHVVFEVRHVSVRDFQKPAFTIESEIDSNVYFPGEDVTVTAKIAFYDGTPVPNTTVDASYFDTGKRQWIDLKEVETDGNGKAVFSFPAWPTGGHVTGSLTTSSYSVRIASDGENITHLGRYSIFPSDILIDTQMQRQGDGENISLTIETFAFDKESQALKAALESEDSWLDNDRLLKIAKGEPVDVKDLRISFTWNYYDQDKERHRHNFQRWINYYDEDKKTYQSRRMLIDPDFNYKYIVERNPDVPIKLVDDKNTDEKMLEVSTKDGSVTIDGILFLGETGIDWNEPVYSQATVRFGDTWSNSRTGWGYYPRYSDYYEDWSSDSRSSIIEGYSLAAHNLTSGENVHAQSGRYNYAYVDIGDTLQFNLIYDSEPVKRGGKILYSLVQDGVIEHRIVSGDSFNLKYILDYGPNLNLAVVYFDGHNIRPISQSRLHVNARSMQLNVDVKSDKEVYAPGDTVRLAVRTTDKNGKGVPANICVAVVDEAVFAVSEQHIYLWSDFYDDIRFTNNEVWQYFTLWRGDPPDRYRDSNGKDGNSKMVFYDNFRSNFKDTAAFLPASTNRSGNANLTFQLPDNNTSWRITSLAVGDNLMPGQAKDNFISSLPFFVRPVTNTKYIEGDDIAMLVQGHGIVLNADSDVSFVVNLTGDNFNKTVDFEGKAYVSHELNFGKLPSGAYTLTFQAKYATYIDTIVLPVSIIKSNLELVISREIDLTQKLDIEASRYPVTLTFYDSSAHPFITSLNSLFGHYCMQTSQRMSRVVAKQALRDSMPGAKVPSYVAETSENISDMQNVDGGIGSYIGGSSDPLLTTYVMLASSGNPFDLRAMAEYYKGILKQRSGNTPMTTALCHLGLAAIGDEMITTELLKTELDKTKDLEVKAHYVAAIAVLGDRETALLLYEQHCAPYMAGSHTDQTTAAVWVAATMLNHDDADVIALYFGNMSWRISTLYECMIYARHFSKMVEPSTLKYTIGGQEHSIEFGATAFDRHQGGFMRTLALSASDLESLEFTHIPESIRATVYYIGEPSEIGLEPSDNMAVEKTIKPVDDKTYEVTLKITLNKDAPQGQYDISDWIPSNTRLYEADKRYEISGGYTTHFNTRQELQNLYITFNRSSQGQQTVIYKYRVRQVFESEAVLDTAYMIHGDTGENANSEKSVFIVD